MCISSSSVVSRFIATTKPWISSVTSEPTMWAPSNWPVFLSKITLTMPWSSPCAIALPLPTNGKPPDANFASCFPCLRFRQPDRGDLRMAIGAAGNQVLVHRMRMHALDRFNAVHALMFILVRQHRRPGDVTDGIDARHIGLPVAVDHDVAAVGLHTELFQPKVLDIADHAHRRDDAPPSASSAALAILDGFFFLWWCCSLMFNKNRRAASGPHHPGTLRLQRCYRPCTGWSTPK